MCQGDDELVHNSTGVRVVPFEKHHQEAVINLFFAGLTTYDVSPSVSACQRDFARTKAAPGGDMHDIFETYMNPTNGDDCKMFWVALDDSDNVVGHVGVIMSTYDENLKEIYDSPDENPQNVCELVRMSVSGKVRGKGIGRKLYDAVESFAVTRNMKKIVLSTLEKMNLAVGLYEKCGFKLLMKESIPVERVLEVADEVIPTPEEVIVVHYGKKMNPRQS